jgi:hypothetical protein
MCSFRIRASNIAKKGWTITKIDPHTCSPAVHYKNKHSHSVKYLIEHHRASIIDNRHITAAQIRSNKRINWSNDISYLQAYRTIQAVLTEMYSDKADSFAKFPAYAERFKAADPENFCKIETHKETGHFTGAFFAPAGLRHAHKTLFGFIGVDGTHTASRFRMNLLIAGGTDANGETIPLAWALVPIENEGWWKWFFKQCKKAFKNISAKRFVIMSDREKGLSSALEEMLPDAIPSYCCQHIADNIRAKFGTKYQSFFWKCARAKTEDAFDIALQKLQTESIDAWDYVKAIPYKTWA